MVPDRRHEHGFALVIVLWGVTLIALVATALAQSTGVETRRFANVRRASELHAALRTGLSAAGLGLLESDPTRRWRADGTHYRARLYGYDYDIAVAAEAGRVDLNHSPPARLRALLDRLAGPPVVAEWIAAGRTALAAGQPNHREVLSVVELTSAPSLTPAVFRRLVAAVTVHNGGGLIDWRLANDDVLLSLPGVTPAVLERLHALRGDPAAQPDAVLKKLLADDGADIDFSTADNLAYTVHVRVSGEHGNTAVVDAVVRVQRNGDVPLRIVEWREPGPEARP